MRNGEAVDLVELIARFGDDQHCRNYLEALRWPDGVRCPKCNGAKISSILKRDQYNCDNESCRYQFSVTAGTIFHDTHLPLVKWFLATYILCQSRKGMSANQLKRMLGISYKTAWYLAHRVRSAMRAADGENGKLAGTVEIDETYVGGKPKRGSKRGRGTPKEVVIGIRQRGGDLRFFHADDVKSGTLAKYIRENVSSDVDVVMTDQFSAYHQALGELDEKHQAINHSLGVYSIGDLHTNTVESAFSLLKRGIVGTWHRISAKHLAAYLDEMTWRFNNRKNPFLFRDTILRLIHSENLEYKELTAA
ncbi:MAG TPA: IS1595 family transposase [Terriglobales bacterium]|nr:IS1595 family transposase [Terriglobales bacterium]